MSRVWWNGHEMPQQKLPTTPGSRLGDGVLETLRTYEGVPFLLDAHLERLFSGARSIRLVGLPSRRSLDARIRDILGASRRRDRIDHVVRILLTEGGARTDVTVVLDPLPTGAAYQGTRGLRVGTSSYPHPGAFFLPAGAKGPAKWVGRGPLVHALREAQRRGWDEAILANARGAFVEGTRSNLFAVVGGRLVAPGPRAMALQGVTRNLVLVAARRKGWRVEDRPVTVGELRRASEAFLTSSLLGVVPIVRWGRWHWGSEGPVVRTLRAAHSNEVRRANERSD